MAFKGGSVSSGDKEKVAQAASAIAAMHQLSDYESTNQWIETKERKSDGPIEKHLHTAVDSAVGQQRNDASLSPSTNCRTRKRSSTRIPGLAKFNQRSRAIAQTSERARRTAASDMQMRTAQSTALHEWSSQ